MNLPILQLYTLGDTLHILDSYGLVEPYMIDLLLHVGGMSKLTGEVSIVGDEDDPSGITV